MPDARPEHVPQGDPCVRCGLPPSEHRTVRLRDEYYAMYQGRNSGVIAERRKNYQRTPQARAVRRAWRKLNPEDRVIIGVDGEGWTDRETGEHHYSYMCASTSEGRYWEVEGIDGKGLKTEAIFDFLLGLPQLSLIMGFSLGYDKTKWIEGMPAISIHFLNHPELRPGKWGPRGIWWSKYRINSISTKFTLELVSKRILDDQSAIESSRHVIVWDLFRFFGKAFVPALKDWKTGSTEELEAIQKMKDDRGNFNGIQDREKLYCRAECRLMAQMATTLVQAHDDADLKLRTYYGPGSTASIMLGKMDAKGNKAPIPDEMKRIVDMSFFGGRFEHSWVGPVRGMWSYDIASAYPFAMTQLPCFKHGQWRLVKRPTVRQIEEAKAASVHWRLPMTDSVRIVEQSLGEKLQKVVKVAGRAAERAWGPFPFRLMDGNILFPVVARGGWVWKQEYLAALNSGVFPNVECTEAWLWESDCSCPPPFAKPVADYYCLRLEWGKDGKGLVVKLGLNSDYGKLAQRVGHPPFQDIVSAGIITSTCRGMLLTAAGYAKDPWSITGFATDSIQSTEPLDLPAPPITGTEDKAREKGKFPLGAWDGSGQNSGEDTFLIRPGMRFKINCSRCAAPVNRCTCAPCPKCRKSATECMCSAKTAARGIGVRTLHNNRVKVLEAWEDIPCGDIHVQQPPVFWGSKSCIRPDTRTRETLELLLTGRIDLKRVLDAMAGGFVRDEKYGRWLTPEPRRLSYSPLPKRPRIVDSSSTTSARRMLTWALDDSQGESLPYGVTEVSEIVRELQELKMLESEQPDQGGLQSLMGEDE
jgi:DNA polymerase type B, organellar and viral